MEFRARSHSIVQDLMDCYQDKAGQSQRPKPGEKARAREGSIEPRWPLPPVPIFYLWLMR